MTRSTGSIFLFVALFALPVPCLQSAEPNYVASLLEKYPPADANWFASATAAPSRNAASTNKAAIHECLSPRRRGPKTLMHWAGAAPSEHEGASDRLITDRPHFAEAASLVGLGRVQIETGYTYFFN